MIDELETGVPNPGGPVPMRSNEAPRASAVAWAVAALVLGTVIAVDPAGFVPTGPLRWTVITVLTGVAVAALACAPITYPRRFTALWVAFIGLLSIATITAVDPLHAWIGTPDRRLGLLAWITFPLLFLVGYSCSTPAATRLVLRAATLGALVLGVWSATEMLGVHPLGLEFADARAGGPFGQPAYLGAACVLFGPLAAAVALDSNEGRWWRRGAVLGTAGVVLAVALSQTRAAWVGAIVALVALLVRQRGGLRRHFKTVAIAAVACVAVVIAVASATSLGARATSTFDLHEGTSASRFDEWRIAARMIDAHPIFGVGPEGYRVVFPQVVDASYVRKYGTAVYPDRAHNGVLDVAATGGIVAGLLYAGLLVSALRYAWRALARKDPVDVALGAAVIAYVVQQQFLFPLAELDPILWILVGMLVARTNVPARRAVLKAKGLAAPIALATVVALTYGARDVLADQWLRRATRAPDQRIALQDADHATRLRPDSIRVWYVDARIAQEGDAITDVDAALDRVLQGLDRSPRDPALRDLYGELLVERAARSQLGTDIATARRELERLVADAPHDPKLRDALVSTRSLRELGSP